MTAAHYPDRAALRQRIQAIHSSGISLVILASGGGFELLTELTAISGASAVLMDAVTPYSKRALADHVKVPPSQIVNDVKVGSSVCQETAILMAHAAWTRAASLCPDRPAVGLAVTAQLASTKPHRSGDFAWIAVQSGVSGENVFSMRLAFRAAGPNGRLINGSNLREAQSQLVGCTALWVLADFLKNPGMYDLSTDFYQWIGPDLRKLADFVAGPCIVPPLDWPSADFGHKNGLIYTRDGKIRPSDIWLDASQHYIMGGRFSPVHWGHFAMKAYLDRVTGKQGIFNLTRIHPKKGRLSDEKVRALLEACAGKVDVLLDNETSYYVDKARLWACDLAMGSDAFALLQTMKPADLEEIARLNVTVHVVKRGDVDWQAMGKNMTSGRVRFYSECSWPVSSTEIRGGGVA